MIDPCRGLYPCDDCTACPCNCECRGDDPAPNTYPHQSGDEAWTEKKELTT